MKKSLVDFTDFLKLDARAGEIKTALKVENSNKLLELTLDLGEEYGVVTILSGIAKFFALESLIGKKVPVLANISPKQKPKRKALTQISLQNRHSAFFILHSAFFILPSASNTPPAWS